MSRKPPEDPLAGIRTKIGDLQRDITSIKDQLAKPTVRSRAWAERSWLIPVVIGLITGLAAACWYVGGLILDKHILTSVTAANGPLQTDIHRVDGDIQQVKATVNVLQAQILIQKYSVAPVKDLKEHRDELNGVRSKLAFTSDSSAPGYWVTSFQIISLASKASAELSENLDKPEGSTDNVIK